VITHQQVGRFEIRDFLGRGAIGDVHLAWDPERHSEVALKLVRMQRADPEMLEAERNGVALQRQLSTVAPQVAAVYEEGESAGFFWVAMEYVAGTDLSEIVSRGPLSETRAVLIAEQLCAMLEVCHQFSAEVGSRRIAGIIHGDIKPENIRLQENDRVRVLDFGIAKHLSQTRRFTVNLFGSLPYTPPERLDRGAVDRQSDLWAVGVVLYLMVSGRPPFTGDDPEELERKIRRGEPPSPLPAELSPKLRKIIQKSLAFDVGRRYASAGAMKADLDAWLHGLPLPSEAAPEPAADVSATRRTSPTSPTSSAEGAPLDLPPRPPPAPGETRRTGGPAAADSGPTVLPFRREVEATRRTTDPALIPPPPSPPPLFPAPADEARQDTAALPKRRWWLILLVLAAIVILMDQAWVRGESREIQRALVGNANPDLDALWERYRSADQKTLGLGIGLGAAREELRSAFRQQAERILDSFHGDNPHTTEKGWERAQHDFEAALDLDYDRETRARMIYCRAHLDRIASQTLRNKGQKADADKKLEDAIAGFRDAARRAPDWPDPFLGLERVYSYEAFDLDALQKAIGELGKRGYPIGRREKAMLADGFRRKGIEMQARSEQAARPDDQEEMKERARENFEQALNLYAEIPGYGDSKANSADVQQRLEEMNGPPVEAGPGARPVRRRGGGPPKVLRDIERILKALKHS
jgi:serine/threonine protein kinase/tetratricopeptide (TPR) repeat protein